MKWIVKKWSAKSHLSKWPSDLKINGTQENVTFSGTVFHGLSCGVFLFVVSVSFKNHSHGEMNHFLMKNTTREMRVVPSYGPNIPSKVLQKQNLEY